jgi:putative hemolysin
MLSERLVINREIAHNSINSNINGTKLTMSLARDKNEVEEAQHLRYKVFSEEMGANIQSKNSLDQDGFDIFCDHLIIRESIGNKVVGTYRILNPKMANEAGGYYSAGEFDISRLQPLFDRTVEVGRACVHPEYRNGGTIAMLWGGLAKYMQANNYEYMMGCGSVGMSDGGHVAASLYKQLASKYLAPSEYRVFPHCALPLEALNQDLEVSCPPLIKGYLRLGAYICGEPAWDPDFNTADMLVMLPLSRMNKRYSDHFFK